MLNGEKKNLLDKTYKFVHNTNQSAKLNSLPIGKIQNTTTVPVILYLLKGGNY